MSYAKASKDYEDKAQAPRESVQVSTACKAHGCPNAGSMVLRDGEQGVCYSHWREPDSTRWGAVSFKIKNTWPEMANWGTAKTEHEAAKAALRRAKQTHQPAGFVQVAA